MAYLRFICACLILVVLGGPAYGECFSPDTAIKKMKTVGAYVVVDLSGVDAKPLVQAYNESPPVSHIAADRVLIFHKDKHPLIVLALFNVGCSVGTMFPTVRSFLARFPKYRARLERVSI